MDNSQLLRHSKFWDRTGIVVAALCLIHCVLFPLIVIALPAFRVYFNSPLIEGLILFTGIGVGSISFITSYKRHRKPYPLMLGLLGVTLLTLNLLFIHEGELHDEAIAGFAVDPLMIVGGSLLIIGHIWNIHACHCFCEPTCSHEEHHPHE